MLNPKLLLSLISLFPLLAPTAEASLDDWERRASHAAIQPRIVAAYTDEGRLFITGRNLPEGNGVEVRLGERRLPVLLATRSLVIASLPSPLPHEVRELVVERGVTRAFIRGDGVRWGLVLPRLPR